MPYFNFDLAVVGGGIVGLSVAMDAVLRFPRLRIAVLEKEPRVACHQTGHNSGVIHSGIYYKPGSLKAKNCVAGAAAMVSFCKEHGISHEICGKVVVATRQEEMDGLIELQRRGVANGVADLAVVGPDQLKELEPYCQGLGALHVPGAGIVDYVAVAQKYAEIILANGGSILTDCEVKAIRKNAADIVFETRKGAVAASWAVNCAGLHSDRIAKFAGDDRGLKIVPFRGEYYELASERRRLARNLIYPVADPRFPFLGVHFTRKIQGGVEVGPNAVLAFKREGYSKTAFDARDAMESLSFPGFWRMSAKYWSSGVGEYYRSINRRAFTRALQKLVPDVRAADLVAGGSGVRAQAVDRQGRLLDDFAIVRSERMVHVCNVPSPAATASLVIGRQVIDMAASDFRLAA